MIMRLLVRATLCGFLAIAGLSAALAHEWQSESQPLDQTEVTDIVTALQTLARDAQTQGWQPPQPKQDPIAVVYLYAASADRFDALPHGMNRVLLTYQALAEGQLLPDGSYADGADFFSWSQLIHAGDTPAVVDQMTALDEIMTLFGAGK
jgi:hypothetical protein